MCSGEHIDMSPFFLEFRVQGDRSQQNSYKTFAVYLQGKYYEGNVREVRETVTEQVLHLLKSQFFHPQNENNQSCLAGLLERSEIMHLAWGLGQS